MAAGFYPIRFHCLCRSHLFSPLSWTGMLSVTLRETGLAGDMLMSDVITEVTRQFGCISGHA